MAHTVGKTFKGNVFYILKANLREIATYFVSNVLKVFIHNDNVLMSFYYKLEI